MEIMLFRTFNKGTVKGAKYFRVEIEHFRVVSKIKIIIRKMFGLRQRDTNVPSSLLHTGILAVKIFYKSRCKKGLGP